MIVSDAEDLAQLAGEWDALLDDSAQSFFTARPFWLLPWWRHFAPPGAELRAIACRDAAGALVGLAPLYFDPAARELRFIGVSADLRAPSNVSATVPARRGLEAAVIGAIVEVLSSDREWRRLWLAR